MRLLTALLALVLSAAPAGAFADNTAVAVNTKDDSSVIKIAFKIERVMKETVTTGNAAVAVSSCSACQTVAIAIDAVFVMSDPQVYAPTNLAIAYNVDCSGCSTLADAYQFVMTTGGAVHLTPEGSQEVAQIRQQLEALRHCDCSIFDIQQQVTVLTDQLQQVLSTQVVPAGQPDAQPGASPAPGASPEAPGAAASPQPSSQPTTAASPSVSPAPSPSATP